MASASADAPAGAILASLFFNEDILPFIIHHLGKADAKGLRLLSRGLRTAFDKQSPILSVTGPDGCTYALAARCIMRGCRPQVLSLGGHDAWGAQAFLHTLIDAAAATPGRPERTNCLHFWSPLLLSPALLRSAGAALPGLTQLSLVVWHEYADRRDAGEAALLSAMGGGSDGAGGAQPPLLPSVRSIRLTYGRFDTLTPGLHAALTTSSQLRELILEGEPLTELAQVEQIACLSQLQSLTLKLEDRSRRPNVGYRDALYLPEDGYDEPPLPELDDPQPAPGDPPTERTLVCTLLPGQLTGLTRLELSSVGTALPAAALRGLTRLRELVGYDVDVAGVSGLCALTSLKANHLVPFVGGKPWVADATVPVSTVESWPLPPGLERLVLSPQHPEELGFLSPGPGLREVALTGICGPSPSHVTLVLNQGRHTASEDSEELLPAAEEALCRAAAFLAAYVKSARCLSISFDPDEALGDVEAYPRLQPVGGAAAMAEGRPSHGRWLAAVGAVPSLTRLVLTGIRLAPQDFDSIANHMPGLETRPAMAEGRTSHGRWLAALGGIMSLTYFELDGIQLAPQDFEAMATHMTGVRVLELNGLCTYPVEALAELGPMTNLQRLYLHVDEWHCHDNDPDEGFSNAVLRGLGPGLLGLYSYGGFDGAVVFEGLAGRTESELRLQELREAVERVEAEVGRGLETAADYWLVRPMGAGKVPTDYARRVSLMTQYCAKFKGQPEVPDLYYGGPAGFERVLDLLEDACEGLLGAIRAERGF
ncbi:hypothetical protein HYH03_018091 [Edaphochlamys debaryana]|uniref:F-box domain-containing protein n=1 Tax=Edaphochlamys debaryana TaxID=47281 RepID=A0A836BN93_9CHLO|nr:hypothetical protein HYH03_018091 [Edaphochlamys debaryana]|eukprot:KAG2483011.1 hypothetical protein HYH03_018091 [Edaphochlamys debaryana]